jgi:group I intron endonuclease
MLPIPGVYEIKNVVNGHKYIGSSVNVVWRLWGHKHALNLHQHHNPYFQNAWNKHGEQNFILRVLLYCDRGMLLIYEQMCLDAFKPEYNICTIAGSTLGIKLSESARRKMCEARKGRVWSEETKRKMSLSSIKRYQVEGAREEFSKILKEAFMSEEIRANVSKGLRKWWALRRENGTSGLSEELKHKISLATKGKPKSEETKLKMRKPKSAEHRAHISAALKGRTWKH